MNQAIQPPILLAELDLGSARGGKAGVNKTPLEVSIIRSLDESDLPAIQNPPPVAAPAQTVKSIRHSHHRLAQLIAEGKPGTEIALVTGYSQSYISTLQGGPAFEELIGYYAEHRKEVFVDAPQRLKALGLDATEKLHERLDDPAVVWSNSQLMDLIGMTGINAVAGKGGQPLAGPPGSGAAVSLEIKFVGATPRVSAEVDGQFTDVTPGAPIVE